MVSWHGMYAWRRPAAYESVFGCVGRLPVKGPDRLMTYLLFYALVDGQPAMLAAPF